jgi:hypothetical protein
VIYFPISLTKWSSLCRPTIRPHFCHNATETKSPGDRKLSEVCNVEVKMGRSVCGRSVSPHGLSLNLLSIQHTFQLT